MNGQTVASSSKGGDILVVIGVVACLGLGAAMTYWLTRAPAAPAGEVKVAAVQGSLLNAAPQSPSNAAAPGSAGVTPAPVAPAPPVAGETPALPAASADSDFLPVSFATLGSYYYELPDAETLKSPTRKDPIPAPIKALNRRKVAVQGFMVATKLEKGMAKSFLLVKDQSLCCFGRIPRMNDWVSVKMSGNKATRFIGDQPVTVFGTLDVGESVDQGQVMSIYRLDAEDVAGPLDF